MKIQSLLSPTRFHIATNTGSQIAGKMINSGATFLITLFIARSYGVNGYGDFTKITTYIAFFYLLGDFGLNAIYLQKQKKDDSLWGVLFGVRLIGSILLIFIALALLSFLPQGQLQGYTPAVRLAIILFSPAIFAQAIITTANALFQKYLRYDLSTLALSIGSIVAVILVWIVTIVFQPQIGVLFASIAFFVGLLVTAVVSVFLASRLEKLRLSFRLQDMSPLLISSIPLGLTLLCNQVYFRVDSLILTLSRQTSDVGIYGLAYKLFEVPLAFPTFFMNSVYPLFLVQAKIAKTKELQKMIGKVGWFLSIGAIVLVVLLWLAAPLISLIRVDFLPSIAVFRILILGLPFFFVSSLTMWTLIALGKQMTLLAIYAFTMIMTILLDLYFIPLYGVTAAAWITVGSEAVVLSVSGIVLQHSIQNIKEESD